VRGGLANNEVTILPRGRDALEMFLARLSVYFAEGAEQAGRAQARRTRAPAMAAG
jgi:hypothetical protein